MAVSVRHYLIAVGTAWALLAGCGGSIGVPGTARQSSVTPSEAKLKYRVLYSFQGGSSDGSLPLGEEAPLVVRDGLLYGTTAEGGGSGCGAGFGCGTIFSATEQGNEKPIYIFPGQPDGATPTGPPTFFNGAWYGMTGLGGASNNGLIYSVDQSGNERNVYSFKGGSDGSGPFGGLTEYKDALYGTTVNGGKNNLGTVFRLSGSLKERVIHSFGYTDGQYPYVGLTVLNGMLYGVTVSGGANNFGTVFAISPTGKERVVYSFQYGTDGASPQAPLVALGGQLYGTTTDGGGQGYDGTAFKVSTSGKEQVLHRFQESLNDGSFPQSTLLDLNGKLYGTTYVGGREDDGVVFSLTASGQERVVHNFAGGPDGVYPAGGLTAIKGTLYGITDEGGTGPCYNGRGCGTIYALTP